MPIWTIIIVKLLTFNKHTAIRYAILMDRSYMHDMDRALQKVK